MRYVASSSTPLNARLTMVSRSSLLAPVASVATLSAVNLGRRRYSEMWVLRLQRAPVLFLPPTGRRPLHLPSLPLNNQQTRLLSQIFLLT